MHIGVLAVHGNFQEHIDLLKSMKIDAVQVRTIEDLKPLSHLIIPGGESTVISHFLSLTGLEKEISKRVKKKTLSVLGTCAGAILLARKIDGKSSVKPLKLIDISLKRNAYGSQLQSFDADIPLKKGGRLDAAFIRAPKILKVGRKVEVLALYKGNPVLVRQKNIMVATFHPEMRGETKVHELFLLS